MLCCLSLFSTTIIEKNVQFDDPVNVFDEPLLPCSEDPLTGFFRDGCCNTSDEDDGYHTVCVQVTDEFLQYSLSQGNDLSTPNPEFGFPGLQAGDRWCLCAPRWLQAYEEKVAPRVYLTRTHKRSLEIIPLQVLRQYAADLN